MVDIVMSRTQRKTPTVIHKHYAISRIRQFYMRKVKFTQQTLHERLTTILDKFPRLDDIHPFYNDLMNVLYDKDHYKVALGQLNIVRKRADQLSSDYIKLLKYADSLYQAKQLKRAAMGRMATNLKKLHGALGYLEQVRQHLSRLPSIDPNTRTLLIAGFPNVGKSSFINRVTRADVEVQSYAFTTKSLYVGHTDYKYMRWQVIDTPGILDHPLEERNTIEMQAVTALAHLKACILYFMDLSGQCGYSLEQQLSLFRNIRPLFLGKPLVVVINKIDVCRLSDIGEAEQRQIRALVDGVEGARLVEISTLQNIGVAELKETACELLLTHRLDFKVRHKKYDDLQNRLYVAMPVKRDEKEREVFIPDSVRQSKEEGVFMNAEVRDKLKLEKKYLEMAFDVEDINSLENLDLRKKWDLAAEEWKYDQIPEIVNGRNIADWIDPDIEEKLKELEEDEEERLRKEAAYQKNKEEVFRLDAVSKQAAHVIRDRIKVNRLVRAMDTSRNHRQARSVAIKVATAKADERANGAGRGRKRARSEALEQMEAAGDRSNSAKVQRSFSARDHTARSASRKTARSITPAALRSGLKNQDQLLRAQGIKHLSLRKMSTQSKRGESDHHIPNLRPKHLFSGKKKVNGKHDRR